MKQKQDQEKQFYVIQVELPDGYSWFGGLRDYKFLDKLGKEQALPMNFWTPYENEVLFFDDLEKATELNEKLLKDSGGVVLPVEEAAFKYAYKQLDNGLFIAPRRAESLQPGDCFRMTENGSQTWKFVKEIGGKDDRKKYCILISGNGRAKYLGASSKEWVYVVIDTNKQKKVNNN